MANVINMYSASTFAEEEEIFPYVIGERLSDSQDGGHNVEVAYQTRTSFNKINIK